MITLGVFVPTTPRLVRGIPILVGVPNGPEDHGWPGNVTNDLFHRRERFNGKNHALIVDVQEGLERVILSRDLLLAERSFSTCW